VLSAEGVIEITAASPQASCEPNDARLEQGREELEQAREAREATRARVVQDHLRVTQDPTATIEAMQDEEDLESARAEAHGAKADVRQDEDQLSRTHCSGASTREPFAPVASASADVRMEFPAQYLHPLERALDSSAAAITAHRYSDPTPITGRLTSVDTALADGKPIVIAYARLDDSSHQLRDAELVGVAVQLPAA
jgi:hypothetical protein